MIFCHICKISVKYSDLNTNKIVLAMIPVEVSDYSYNKAEWFSKHLDNDITSGLSMFIHSECFNKMLEERIR